MIFLVVLAIATLIASTWLWARHRASAQDAARIAMALAMAVAGTAHWLNPTPFIQHLPERMPMREELILGTGIIEVALGAALLLRQPWRGFAGVILAAYLIGVFPGNVYVAVADVPVQGQPGGLYPLGAAPTTDPVHRLGALEYRRPEHRTHQGESAALAQPSNLASGRQPERLRPRARDQQAGGIPRRGTWFEGIDRPDPSVIIVSGRR